jgi:hypothetical protein
MTIPHKLSSLLVTQSLWVPWLLVGFSTGGVAVLFQRIAYLISISEAFRSLKVRFRLA